jgi:ABC-type multidrug transport system ATPase subunit
MIWGLSKRFQPKWKVEDIKIEMSNIVKRGSSGDINEGLSVSIASRSVLDFFKKKYLLKDINMNIPTGHMVLLLGGSGAGKTTFINAVNGFEKADAEIILDGKNMYTDYNKMKHNVGFVPQPQMMRDKDTVKKTLYDAAEIRLAIDIPRSDKIARVNEVMDIFGLLPIQDSLVEKLSGGQKKRLSICMELLSNPALFILDEPDSGLDGVMARELFARLRTIADDNKIVIVITHSPDRVVDFFDDVIVLAKDSNRIGRLAFFGTIDEARGFFERDSMDEIVKTVNQVEEGGDGKADDYIEKYARMVQNG